MNIRRLKAELRHLRRVARVLPVALLITACSQGPQRGPARPLTPDQLSGDYQYETVVNRSAGNGMTSERLSGILRIESVGDDGYSGEITAGGRSPMPITSVQVGNRGDVTITARDLEGGVITLELYFQGVSFSGQWITDQGRSSPVQGVRRN